MIHLFSFFYSEGAIKEERRQCVYFMKRLFLIVITNVEYQFFQDEAKYHLIETDISEDLDGHVEEFVQLLLQPIVSVCIS